MRKSDIDLGKKLVRLADGVLDELLTPKQEPPSIDQRLDALKAIGTLHLGLLKQGGKREPDEQDGGLPAMRERLKAISGGAGGANDGN